MSTLMAMVDQVQADIKKLPVEYQKLLVIERRWDQTHPAAVHWSMFFAGLLLGWLIL